MAMENGIQGQFPLTDFSIRCNEDDFGRLSTEVGAVSFVTRATVDDGKKTGFGRAYSSGGEEILNAVIDNKSENMESFAISEVGRRYKRYKHNPFDSKKDADFLAIERFYANIYYPEGIEIPSYRATEYVQGSDGRLVANRIAISYETTSIPFTLFLDWVKSEWNDELIVDYIRQNNSNRNILSGNGQNLVVLEVFHRTEVPF